MIQFIAKLQGALPVRGTQRGADKPPLREQRRAPRTLSLFWTATLKAIGWTGPATVVDISPGGMHLRSGFRPSEGDQVVVVLSGVDPLRGNVRWLGEGRFGIQLDREIDVVEIMRARRKATGSHLGIDRLI